ncbi:hypothetical protein BDF20DRAFT_914952 [Mycotypha africana]|uniref:uncharacterized protein n=1 Tax=Mycotypha africana TaxID=64632 RepID=UPI002300E4B6|nr:uncharacterized protein BDF20DRAFT_914952 [Mycotypha africana]KAI8973523.1 hypothetical protein BDF20DRAFT_914952 [Mycotypha africana]
MFRTVVLRVPHVNLPIKKRTGSVVREDEQEKTSTMGALKRLKCSVRYRCVNAFAHTKQKKQQQPVFTPSMFREVIHPTDVQTRKYQLLEPKVKCLIGKLCHQMAYPYHLVAKKHSKSNISPSKQQASVSGIVHAITSNKTDTAMALKSDKVEAKDDDVDSMVHLNAELDADPTSTLLVEHYSCKSGCPSSIFTGSGIVESVAPASNTSRRSSMDFCANANSSLTMNIISSTHQNNRNSSNSNSECPNANFVVELVELETDPFVQWVRTGPI